MESQWFVYLLRCADDTLYCGVTTDMDRRLRQHNAGTASKYTRARTPVRVETFCPAASKSEALKLEWRTKRLPRDRKVAFLEALSRRSPADRTLPCERSHRKHTI